jgi:nucleotide-binding universal stress UspA family protein
MYERILLPYDGSDGAEAILHHASEIAHRHDATVQVLYVADTTRDSVTVVDGQVVDALVREGEDIVEEAGKTLATLGVEYETDVLQGNPAPTITDYAEQYEFDLVVMATRGREGVSRHLLGSVSEKVVRLSSVPVLTARMQPDEQLSYPYEDILVPTDGSSAARHAATQTLSLAKSLGATVHVLSVVDDSVLDLDLGGSDAGHDSEAAADEAIEEIRAEASEHDVETVQQIEHGSPVEVIQEYVTAHDIDAVVMGTTGNRTTEDILLGSVAEQTVRTAPVPVMTISEPK